eukprot:TRINITY_DN2428_c0_g1_i5.p1 TRINITY_DN2428_c0_g1~~TRINITY_DN2428_c0_g1_i5.p1  ORF type:complete len:140 (-),score=36.92 TRINITY_DN2428_c0_g1_i5:119-538(-)
MNELGVPTDETEVDSLFQRLDINKDGSISFSEFVKGLGMLGNAQSILASVGSNSTTSASDLETKNKVLHSLLQEISERVLSVAKTEADKGNTATAKAILTALDYPLLQEMDDIVGAVTTKELSEKYSQLSKQLQTTRKK